MDRDVLLWRLWKQLQHQVSHSQDPRGFPNWDKSVFFHPKVESYRSQNLHYDHLVMFHQLKTENKEVLIFHSRVKKHELCQNTYQPDINCISLISLPVTVASSRHFHSFWAFAILILKCLSVQFSWDIPIFNNTFAIMLSFLLQTSLKSSTAVRWHVDSFAWINEKGVGSGWQRFLSYY